MDSTSSSAPNAAAAQKARQHMDQLTKPPGSLGRLEDLAVWAAGVQDRVPAQAFAAVHLVIVAADHGVGGRTSAYPSEVTGQMVRNFAEGGAAANQLADQAGVQIEVLNVGVRGDLPDMPGVVDAVVMAGSQPIDTADALTGDQYEEASSAGAATADRLIDSGADLLIVGDMGIGNTTAAAAILARVLDRSPDEVCGRGTGISDVRWMVKIGRAFV